MSGHTAEVGADLLPAIGVEPLHFPLMGAHLMEQSNLVCFLSACPMSELRALWEKAGRVNIVCRLLLVSLEIHPNWLTFPVLLASTHL